MKFARSNARAILTAEGKFVASREKDIQDGILHYLSLNKRGFFWRNNTGGFSGSHKGKKWFVKTGLKGSGDILGLAGPEGKFVAIEVKTAIGKQNPDQKEFQRKVEALGGIYILARGVDDVRQRGL